MLYPLDLILTEVRTILDQNQQEGAILADEDNTLELDEIITQKALHAARLLLEKSDVSLLGEGVSNPIVKVVDGEQVVPQDWGEHNIIDPIYIHEMEDCGYGELSVWVMDVPEKYLRLLSLKMSDWKRAVHFTIPFESAEYSELKSGFIGISGNPERPAVAEVKDSGISISNGNPDVTAHTYRHFEIYTSATGEVDNFRYIKIPEYVTITEGTGAATYLEFPEKLFRHLLYQTAAFVAVTYKDGAMAQALMNMVYEGEPESKEGQ